MCHPNPSICPYIRSIFDVLISRRAGMRGAYQRRRGDGWEGMRRPEWTATRLQDDRLVTETACFFIVQFRFLFCPEPVLVKSPGPFLTLRNLSTDAPPFLQGRRGPRAGPGVVTAAASEQTGHHLRRPASPDRCLRHNGYTCWRQHCRARCLRTGEVPAPSKTHNMRHPISSTICP